MPYQDDGDLVSERISRAAETLLGEVGEGFTVDRLAEEAGISRATVYRRVGSKDALLRRLARKRGVELGQRPDARTRILRAARRVFGRHGLVGATVEQVAEEAGVGVVTVYRRFGDKDGLVRAFVGEMSPHSAVQEIVVHPGESAAEDLATLATTALRVLHENRDIFRLILLGNEAERTYLQHLRAGSGTTLDHLAGYFGRQIKAGRLRDAGDPRELGMTFMGMVVAFAVIGPEHYGVELGDPERIGRMISSIFLEGLEQ